MAQPKAPTKKQIEEVSSHLAWSFLQVLDKDIISELQSQISELSSGDDEASEFVKQDPEGHVLFTLLESGLEKLAAEAEQEEWQPVEIFAVAWMIRDLVVETPAQVTE
jgi:hypothetical protein